MAHEAIMEEVRSNVELQVRLVQQHHGTIPHFAGTALEAYWLAHEDESAVVHHALSVALAAAQSIPTCTVCIGTGIVHAGHFGNIGKKMLLGSAKHEALEVSGVAGTKYGVFIAESALAALPDAPDGFKAVSTHANQLSVCTYVA